MASIVSTLQSSIVNATIETLLQCNAAIADMKNVGGRPGGSITAALILQKFVAGLPWAHLDIAGVAWRKPSHTPTVPDGASGFGVRLLNRMVADAYED
jgi:leucyl aminopeptidase